MPCKYSNYSNPLSLTSAPTAVNVPQTVPIDAVDTADWVIDPATQGLVCKNAGVWNILAQYQLVNINPTDNASDAQIDGWYIINGEKLDNSDAANTASCSTTRTCSPLDSRTNSRRVMFSNLVSALSRPLVR